MELVYIDSLFFLNLAVDYFLLLCSARVGGAVLRRPRIALGALLGALYSVLCVLPGCAFASSAPVKISAALMMCVLAFGGERKLLRCCVVFLAVSAAFGGAVWALSIGESISGSPYIPVSLPVLALSFALCYAALSLAFRRSSQRAERRVVDITLSLAGRETRLRAMLDTGNGLFDPMSGRQVMVADGAALRPLLPAAAWELLGEDDAAIQLERLSVLPELRGRLTLAPYSAVGIKSGLLCCIRPDSALADGRRRELTVGISPHPLSDDGAYSAIIQEVQV